MGVETLILGGLAAAGAVSSISSANQQAKALAKQGQVAAQEKAKQVSAQMAQQKTSFLSSELELEGTPMSVISSTANVGRADIENMVSNYNSQIKNVRRQGWTNALGSVASMGAAMYAGGMFDGLLKGAGGAGSGLTQGGALDSLGSFSDLSSDFGRIDLGTFTNV